MLERRAEIKKQPKTNTNSDDVQEGKGYRHDRGPATVTESTDEQIKFEVNDEDISAEWAGQPFGGKLKARGGNPSDPQQEITLEGEIEG